MYEDIKITNPQLCEKIEAAYMLKNSIDEMTAKLKSLNSEITRMVHEQGQESATIKTTGIVAKIGTRETWTYDQKGLTQLAQTMPEPEFKKLFRIKYEGNLRELKPYLEYSQDASEIEKMCMCKKTMFVQYAAEKDTDKGNPYDF